MTTLLSSAFKKNIPQGYDTSLERLDDVVLETILLRLVEALPEEKLPEFEAALSLSDSRVLEGFLANEVPNLRYIVSETLSELEHGAVGMISILES